MGAYLVADGSVKIGTNDVAEVTGYQYSDRVNLIRDDGAFDDDESYQVGKKGGGGRVKCRFDPTDTSAQNTMRSGASVVLHIRPGGTGAGKKDFTGTVLIEEFGLTGEDEGLSEAEFGFKGLLTEASA